MSNNTFEKVENYLEHHGIKGQKWGIRRYQNIDGSLTELGKKRYGHIQTDDPNELREIIMNDVRYEQMQAEINQKNIEKNWEKAMAPGPDAFEIGVKAATDTLKTAEGYFRTRKKSGVVKKDYSDIPDDELKRRVNRLNLEENYGRLTGDTYAVATRKDKIHEWIQDAFITVSLVSTVISAITALKGLKSKKE